MITERKRWMTYTYFNRQPDFGFLKTHLFSMVDVALPMMARVPFPTMVVDLDSDTYGESWSASARTKIHRAQQEDLAVDRGSFLLSDILKMFNPRARIKGLRGFEVSDFDAMPYIECSAVYYDRVMLCGHVWLIDEAEKRAMLYVNASNHANEAEDRSLTGRAHYFLLWQDGLYLRHLGMQTMDLMGYEPNALDESLKGVYQWKAGTHGRTEVLYHYYPRWFYAFRTFRKKLLG